MNTALWEWLQIMRAARESEATISPTPARRPSKLADQ
jgi:hypothetical protein